MDINKKRERWKRKAMEEALSDEGFNISKIISTCPVGTALWSPVCGDCILEDVIWKRVQHSTRRRARIIVRATNSKKTLQFDAYGKLLVNGASVNKGGECLLFPSCVERKWTCVEIEGLRLVVKKTRGKPTLKTAATVNPVKQKTCLTV